MQVSPLVLLARGPGAEGKLWGEGLGSPLTLGVQGGERVEGAIFATVTTALVWTDTGLIYHLDLAGNTYRKLGRPGRVAFLVCGGCRGGEVLVGLKGGLGRVLVLDTREGRVGRRVRRRLEHGEEVEGAFMGPGGLVALWGEEGASLWRGPVLVARLHSSCPLLGVVLLEEEVVTLARDGRVAVWGVGGGLGWG